MERTPVRPGTDVVLVGGSGHVGRVVARVLAPRIGERLVIVGRDERKGRPLIEEIGHGVRFDRADVTRDADRVLASARVVVVCLDLPDTSLAERCLRAGVDYVDVTADQRMFEAFESLGRRTEAARSSVVVSVGLAPGLTNLLAAAASSNVDGPTRVDLYLMLGLGDAHGDASVAWTLDNFDTRFEVPHEGRLLGVRAFGEASRFRLPGERTERSAYRFNFPDQRTIARTLDLPTAATWLCFDSRWVTWLCWALVWSGASRLLRWAFVRRWAAALLRHGTLGGDRWAVVAKATARDGRRLSCALEGRREAEITGQVAAAVVRRLLHGGRAAGVLHLEQFVRLEQLLEDLRDQGAKLRHWPAA